MSAYRGYRVSLIGVSEPFSGFTPFISWFNVLLDDNKQGWMMIDQEYVDWLQFHLSFSNLNNLNMACNSLLSRDIMLRHVVMQLR